MTEDLADIKARLVVGHKRDGRNVYDEAVKTELVMLCLKPGASISRLARECGINTNQVTRWLREHGQPRRAKLAAPDPIAPPQESFVQMPVVMSPKAPRREAVGSAAMNMQARLPNGVVLELGAMQSHQLAPIIEALGSLRCSVSTKG